MSQHLQTVGKIYEAFGNNGKVLRFRHYIDTAMQIWVASKQWSVT